jgi:hypothetical protein
VPIPASRLASCVGALSATVIVGGMCAGAATAGPDSQTDVSSASDSSKGNLIGATLGAVGALTRGHGSSQPVHSVLAVPKAVIGTVQGTAARTVAVVNAHLPVKKGPAKAPDKVVPDEPAPIDAAVPTDDTTAPPDAAVADPVPPAPPAAPVPAVAPVPVAAPAPPVPRAPVLPVPVPMAFVLPATPFTPATVYSVDLTTPVAAYSTAVDTYETTNALVTDAVQPYNVMLALVPTPEPQPEPQMKVFEKENVAEAPAIDVSGEPSPVVSPSGSGMQDLSVVRMPMVVPAAAAFRLAPPRPFSEASPPAATPQGLVGGGAVPAARGSDVLVGGAAVPQAVRASEVRTGSRGAETPLENVTSSNANSSLRQGVPQSLRNARMIELTSVALPGLAGLLAITVSGGVIGFRQASSVRYLHPDADRFLT